VNELEQYIRERLEAELGRRMDDEFKRWIEGDNTGVPMGLEEALKVLDLQ
jgi:hypothetical protein